MYVCLIKRFISHISSSESVHASVICLSLKLFSIVELYFVFKMDFKGCWFKLICVSECRLTSAALFVEFFFSGKDFKEIERGVEKRC